MSLPKLQCPWGCRGMNAYWQQSSSHSTPGAGGIQTHPQTRLSPPAELWGQKWAESTVSSAEGLKLSRPTASSLSPQMVPPYTQVEKPKPRERTRPVSQEQLAVAPLTHPARAALA